jgi:predicted PurR-regulated permease PerM
MPSTPAPEGPADRAGADGPDGSDGPDGAGVLAGSDGGDGPAGPDGDATRAGAPPGPRPVLRLSAPSILRAVAMFGATLAVLAGIDASARVLGWILAAASLAALFHPVVGLLARHLPRALALVVVLLVTFSIVGGIAYAVVDDVTAQVTDLRRALPDAARDVERSDRFGETARDLHLAERARSFVDELPSRLRGGTVNEALRSAATRGVAVLVTTVLTVFFLVYGPRLVEGALRQVPAARRPGIRAGSASAYRRSWAYVSGSLAMAAAAGAVAYLAADVLDLPGKAPLALGVALFDLVPLIGVVLGSVPLVLLAATTSPWQRSVAVTVLLVGWQLVEALWVQQEVERRSLHLGPFVSLVVAFLGLQLYGIGGAFAGLVGAVVAAAVLDEAFGHGPRSASPRAPGPPAGDPAAGPPEGDLSPSTSAAR